MPPISNIRDVSAGKPFTGSTTLGSNKGSGQNAEEGLFSVDGAQKQEALQAVNEKNAGNNAQTTMGQKDLIPLAISSSKNQTLAVETVKDILDTNLLSTAKLNGYTELVGELEHLSASLYIPAKELVREMMEQEKQNTMFSGNKFYDLLRELAKDADPDQKEAIGNMLKAINFSQNRQEITTAVSSNLKFLAEYFSPNRGLSGRLLDLAERWASPDAQSNFASLRGKTADLLQNLSESLLNDSHTQTLIPIVTHNLSKFNTNSSMLREYFAQLLSLIPSYEMRSELAQSFEGLLAQLMKGNPIDNYTINTQKNQVENDNFANQNKPDPSISAYLTKNIGDFDYVSANGLLDIDFMSFVDDLKDGNISAQDTIRQVLDAIIADPGLKDILSSQLDELTTPAQIVDYLNGFLEALPEESEISDNVFAVLEEAVKYLDDEMPPEEDGYGYVEEQYGREESEVNAGSPEEYDEDTAPVKEYHPENSASRQNAENGTQGLSQAQRGEQGQPGQRAGLSAQHGEADRAREDAGTAREAGQNIRETGIRQTDQKKSSSIQALTDFVEKNINHPALKSIDSFNASNLLQSMINAPGVMTPLAHYILPIQIENTRAFGELWVDNNDDSGTTGAGNGSHHHLFLTFDVDTFGRFEVDVYANDKTVRVNLLHPGSFTRNIGPVVEKINRIAASTKYTISDFQTGVLKEPHNLTQIFPKLGERRSGLNVKA